MKAHQSECVISQKNTYEALTLFTSSIFSDMTTRPDTYYNQRTSGLVNAHLTPGPGIYFNAFIHVYSLRAGADKPLGTNVDVNRKPLSLCQFVASFKTISLKYDFKHALNDFIHVHV